MASIHIQETSDSDYNLISSNIFFGFDAGYGIEAINIIGDNTVIGDNIDMFNT